jgi:hypothetical protein
VVLFQLLRTCQMRPGGVAGGGGFCAATTISRVMGPQSADVSVACQVPAAGAATSANHE